MDPDENLRAQLDRVMRINAIDDAACGTENGEWTPTEERRLAYLAGELAELVEALDEWIRNGGALPREWVKGIKRTAR